MLDLPQPPGPNWSLPFLFQIMLYPALLYLFVYRPVQPLANWLLAQFLNTSEDILKPGASDYAVITGATDGIGLEYAKQLAARGYNLVLLSRTEEKLKRVAREISSKYPQAEIIEILAVDFSKTDIYDTIKDKLESLSGRVHVLVNNVGMSHPIAEYFTGYPEGYSEKLINTNLLSMTRMSEIVLRLMLRNPKPDASSSASTARGVIINVSSIAGLTEIPLMSVYSASKAYITFLSRILAYEYAPKGILIQTVTPNLVDTPLASHLEPSLVKVSARDCVKYALACLGSEAQTSGHPWHALLNSLLLWFVWLLPKKLIFKALRIQGQIHRKQYFNLVHKGESKEKAQ